MFTYANNLINHSILGWFYLDTIAVYISKAISTSNLTLTR